MADIEKACIVPKDDIRSRCSAAASEPSRTTPLRPRKRFSIVRDNEITGASRLTVRQSLLPVGFITVLYCLWGFTGGLSETLNKHFKDVLHLTYAQTYGMHGFGALAYFIATTTYATYLLKRLGYRWTMAIGLAIYAVGAFCVIPSARYHSYVGLCAAGFIIGSGMATLEIAAVLLTSLCGPSRYAEIRVLLALGCQVTAQVVAAVMVGEVMYKPGDHNITADRDLTSVQHAYAGIGGACIVILLMTFAFFPWIPEITDADMEERVTYACRAKPKQSHHPRWWPCSKSTLACTTPGTGTYGDNTSLRATDDFSRENPPSQSWDHPGQAPRTRSMTVNTSDNSITDATNPSPSLKDKLTLPLRRQRMLQMGMITLFFFIGAQVALASSFMPYVLHVSPNLNARTAARLQAVANSTFAAGRFIFAFLNRYIKPRYTMLFSILVVLVLLCVSIVPSVHGNAALALMIMQFFFKSSINPTVFTLSSRGLGANTKRGAGLLMASVAGSAVFAPLLGWVTDHHGVKTALLVPVGGVVCAVAFAVWVNGWKGDWVDMFAMDERKCADDNEARERGGSGSSLATEGTILSQDSWENAAQVEEKK